MAWRPLEANEGWLDRRPFHLVSPWAGVGGKTLAQDSGRAPWALLAREGRGALAVRTCQKYQAEIRAELLPSGLKIAPRWEAERPGRGIPRGRPGPLPLRHGWPSRGRAHLSGRATEAKDRPKALACCLGKGISMSASSAPVLLGA